MKFDIQTKLNIGDTVYIPVCRYIAEGKEYSEDCDMFKVAYESKVELIRVTNNKTVEYAFHNGEQMYEEETEFGKDCNADDICGWTLDREACSKVCDLYNDWYKNELKNGIEEYDEG